MARALEPLSKQLTIGIGLTVVGFMAFGLALSYYRNALFEQTLGDMRVQNNILRGGIQNAYDDLEYLRSSQYKDKYAKQNLGLVSPGEKVLILSHKPESILYESDMDITVTERQEAAYLELLRQMPVLEHWQLYLFHPERAEEMRRGAS